jgi:hypothetical protein
MLESLVGSLPKLSGGSVFAPPKIGCNSAPKSPKVVYEVVEAIPLNLAKEVLQCFQIPEASASGDTSHFSGLDDRV